MISLNYEGRTAQRDVSGSPSGPDTLTLTESVVVTKV